ncbi:probable ATP-dependent transporter ycf16 [Cucumis melo]|uniref:Probable ATP-dependent transporter ycf16 n=1 Tax=Cucumis melo TaxID=3656 RepID=A0ABM3L310_CUCME|nr:probable ATP-dependent transporter ycf16 [Cucumis melo]
MAGKGEGPAIRIDLGTKYSCGMEMAEMEMEMEECSFVVSSDPHSQKSLLLEVKNLTAVIAETKQEILKGVNLVVYEGEVHAIMGKNGSGKCTFAKIIEVISG